MNTNQKGKLALITGASSGIGLELAKLHASFGGDLVLVARRGEKLEEIGAMLESNFGVRVATIAIDLSTAEAPRHLLNELESRGLRIDYLVNNAGFSKVGYFQEIEWSSHESLIMLMIRSLTELTYLLLPGMIERGSGRILNVASSAAFAPGGPLQTMYYAAKSYIVSFSQGLAGELEGTGVTVTALCPGATDTEFEKVSGLDHTPLFSMEKVFTPDLVARDGYDAMMRGELVRLTALTGINKFVLKNMNLFPTRKILQQVKERQERVKKQNKQ